MLETQIKGVVGCMATAAVLSLPYVQSPDINPCIANIADQPEKAWSTQIFNPNPYYETIFLDITALRQKEILQKIVSDLLENLEEPNAVFTKVVDDHFWDLI